MTGLIRAEALKLVTTRLWLGLLVAAMGLAALYASLSIAFADDPENFTPPLESGAGLRTLFSTASGGATLAAILGAIGMTGEFRHQTATSTFLATPARGRVVVAKAVTYALAGLGYGVACAGTVVAVAMPWLAIEDIDVSLAADGIPATLAGSVAVMALYALVGVGLGALVRNQVATVVGLLVYLFVAEQILIAIGPLEPFARFLPGAAAGAVTGTSTGFDYLDAWQGGLVLAGYALAFAVLGVLLAVRRDVT